MNKLILQVQILLLLLISTLRILYFFLNKKIRQIQNIIYLVVIQSLDTVNEDKNSLVNIYGDLIGSLVKFQTVGSTIDFRSSFPPVKWENNSSLIFVSMHREDLYRPILTLFRLFVQRSRDITILATRDGKIYKFSVILREEDQRGRLSRISNVIRVCSLFISKVD